MKSKAKQYTTAPKESLGSSNFLHTAIRHWWLFALSFIFCFGILFLYLRKTLPSYIVSSTVLVDDQSLSFAGIGNPKGNSMLKSVMGGGDVNVFNEIEILASENLAAKTVDALDINCRYYEKTGFLKKQDHYGTSPIIVEAPKELFDTLSVTLPFKIKVYADGKTDITVKKGMFSNYAELKGVELPATVKTPFGLFVVKPTQYFTPKHEYSITASVAGNIPAALELQKDMTVDLKAKKTDIVYMDVMDNDVKRGRDILNTLVRLYNERGMKESDTQGMTTARFIDERLSLIYKNLMGSEAEIEAYKKAHSLVDPYTQVKSSIIKGETSESAIIALETQYRIASMIKGFITDPANKHSLIPFESDSLSAKMVRSYNALITQRQHLETSAKADNPALVQLDQQLNAMRENMLGSVNNALGAMRIKIDKAKDVQGESKGDMSQFASTERETRTLYRNQAIQNELYIFLLQKREENALKMAAAQPKGKLVDEAYAASEPVKPKKPLLAFVALMMTFALPFCILYVKKMLKNKIGSQDELEAITPAHLLGQIYHAREDELQVIADTNTKNAELFRYLRGNVQFVLPESTDKVVLVTSAVAAEGKSYIAANVASSLALMGKKVALVELNLRKPSLGEMFGIIASKGMSDYLSNGEVSLHDIVSTTADGLDVYVAGTVPPNPSELLQGSRAAQLMEQLREQYDYVVVDSASLATASDTFSLTSQADATVVVLRANSTKQAYVKWINRLMAEGKLSNVGFVLNGVKNSDDTSIKIGNDK
ncbi:MAG: polysaccharide biosynthesis tyrosine autokinase [Sodaliphilus sp.]|nr:polysaccharide biosynthesis tyrosine autokinase [Bacteroidales bacterium]MDY5538959.1 polysaccharide biosynthesis tyrosine autokinase [Sodaliphilus sp.]